VFAVLTLDPAEHKRAGYELADVFKSFGRKFQKLRQKWEAVCTGKRGLGLDWCGSSWVSVIESHRTGVPHLNVVMHAPKLAQYLRDLYDARRFGGATHREATLLHDRFLRAAEDCGFGWSSTLEAADAANRDRADLDAIAGYVAKVAKKADRLHAEVAKVTQLPLAAPKNFRRVRAGKGFLPPKRKSEEYTGAIVRVRWTRDGDQEAESLVRNYRDPDFAELVGDVVAREQQLAWDAETLRSQRLHACPAQKHMVSLAATATNERVTIHKFPGQSRGRRTKEKADDRDDRKKDLATGGGPIGGRPRRAPGVCRAFSGPV